MKRVLPALALLCALSLTVTACSDGTSADAGSGSQQAVDPVAKLDGVHLTMWVAQNSADQPKQVIDAFEKATGATIDEIVVPDPYESNVPTKLASGDKPDLLFWQPTKSTLPAIQPAANLLPLDNEPWVAKLGKIEQSLGMVDGKRYAAIVSSPAVLGVYYNKDVFARAGITKMPTTYGELLTTAHTIKDRTGVAPFFEVGGDKWPLQWQVQIQLTKLGQSFWDKLNRNQERWTNPVIVQAIADYQDKVLGAGLAQPDYRTATFTDQAIDVFGGKAAMALNVTSLQTQIQASHSTAEIDKTLGWFPISADSATAEYSPDQTNGMVAFKTGDTARQNAARQFLDFFLGPDYPAYLKAMKFVSVRTDVPNPDGLPQTALAQWKALPSATGVFQVKAINAPDMHLALADLIYGKKSPQDVAQAVQDQFAQVAKAQAAPGF